MKETTSNSLIEFKKTVETHLVRNRSILDVMSKMQKASADLNRAITKTVTACGCVEIKAHRQEIPGQASLIDLTDYMESHLDGTPCETCRDAVETEMGTVLFYLAAVCQLFDMDLEAVIKKERDRIETLGMYSLT